MRRVGQYEELADLAVYLLADQSEYLTGEVIAIDGGQALNSAGGFSEPSKRSHQDWAEIRDIIRNINAKGKTKRRIWRGRKATCESTANMWIKVRKICG